MTIIISLIYLLDIGMSAGLSRWAKIRVHRGDEIVDYDVNARGQLETRPPRQTRRTDPFGVRPPPTNTNGQRVARLVAPSEDGCGCGGGCGSVGGGCGEDGWFSRSWGALGDDTNDYTCATFKTNNEEGSPSMPYPEHYLGFADDGSFAFDFGFDSDLFCPSD
jgi:hypothetical protein